MTSPVQSEVSRSKAFPSAAFNDQRRSCGPESGMPIRTPAVDAGRPDSTRSEIASRVSQDLLPTSCDTLTVSNDATQVGLHDHVEGRTCERARHDAVHGRRKLRVRMDESDLDELQRRINIEYEPEPGLPRLLVRRCDESKVFSADSPTWH